MNFSRVQWETEISDGKYKKSINPVDGKPYPESNWVWSPQGVVNMHLPEKWGYVVFLDEISENKFLITDIDPDHKTKEMLVELYHQQKEFNKKNKRYATSLFELNKQGRQSAADIFIEATSRQFLISSRQPNGEILYINHQKRIWKE